MSPEIMVVLRIAAIATSAAIGIVDFFGILFMLLERYGGAKGRIYYLLSYLFPKTIFGPIGKSLRLLRDWHDAGKRETLIQAYGRNKERDLMDRHPFSQWMVAEMVRNYENNVQGIAYLGAAALIFIIGLRGIEVLTREDASFIVPALLLEFTLIGLLGLMMFYKPEEEKHGAVDLTLITELERIKRDLAEKDTTLRTLRADVDTVIQRLQGDVESLRQAGSGGKAKGGA
jgi:hypothetical protein